MPLRDDAIEPNPFTTDSAADYLEEWAKETTAPGYPQRRLLGQAVLCLDREVERLTNELDEALSRIESVKRELDIQRRAVKQLREDGETDYWVTAKEKVVDRVAGALGEK